MFQLENGSSRSCDGINRRHFLRVGSLAAFGLGLPELLRTEAHAVDVTAAGKKDVSCILVWLQGGISHLDSFDPKPEAPVEIRGEFGTVATNVLGIRLCDPLPKLARHQDKYSILRSLDPRNGSHGVADASMMAGHPFSPSITHPSYGSVIAKEKGSLNGMPPFVQVGSDVDPWSGGGTAGFLGDPFNPFVFPKVLEAVDAWQSRVESDPSILEAADVFDARAYSLITAPHAKKAFDIGAEAPRLRDRYGWNSLGQGCLLARRLIEAGVRFVTITDGGWDTHKDNFTALKTRLLPRLDSALSSLLQDLSERGLLDSTLVITLSDFGRTPRINPSAGRDHWSRAAVALLAGGGIRPATVVGQTDARGEQPIEAPYLTEDLAATLYHCLDIPLDTTYPTPDGRSIRVNPEGRVIRELV